MLSIRHSVRVSHSIIVVVLLLALFVRCAGGNEVIIPENVYHLIVNVFISMSALRLYIVS